MEEKGVVFTLKWSREREENRFFIPSLHGVWILHQALIDFPFDFSRAFEMNAPRNNFFISKRVF